MRENITKRFPFSNRGLVQKLDTNLLGEDQYSFLLNMTSFQEGSLRPRLGWRQLNINWGINQPSYVHTLAVSRLDGPTGTLYSYLGEGTNIQRVTYSGSAGVTSVIATNVNTDPHRSSYSIWRNDKSGDNLMAYFATGLEMLRDNGSYGDARVWGIDPPPDFARAAPGEYTFKNLIKSGTFSAAPAISLTNARLSDTISSVTATAAATGSEGYYEIGLTGGATSINKLLPGMYLNVNGNDVYVDKVDGVSNTFYAYFTSLPAAGNTVEAYESGNVSNVAGSATSVTTDPGVVVANLSFGGSAEDGYDTDDTIAMSLYNATPTTVADIRLRILTGGISTDYYEKSILPSPAQDVQNSATTITNTSNAADSLNEYGQYSSTGVYGQLTDTSIQDNLSGNPYIPPPNNISSGLQPDSLVPASGGVWNEIAISKRDFLKVGRAGQSGFTWADVTAVQIIVKPTTTTAVATIKIGSIYAYGGSGLNADFNTALQPYDYVYTYFDPETQAESNPSPLMLEGIRTTRTSMAVRVRGCDNITGKYQGIQKIAVYRRGGAFTDGLFRLVGYIDNPGSGVTTLFTDSADDISIKTNRLAAFDNNAPVTASLPFLIEATVTNVISGGDDQYVLSLSLPSYAPTLTDYVNPLTPCTVSPGSTSSEQQLRTYIQELTATTVTLYAQREILVGEKVSIEVTSRSGCDVSCYAFDRMWLAGDRFNPHVVYTSKTGRPESFPIINEASGNAHVYNVSSPDNPINGIIEFNGEVILLCQNGIYSAQLVQGVIRVQKSPASRGLYAKGAYALIDNEIWFLAYDGIYTWSGNQVTKKSLAIDPIFRGEEINGISQIDFTGTFGTIPAISFFCIAQKGNEVFFNYLTASGWFDTLRYHTIFDRWSLEEYYDPDSTDTITRNGIVLPICSATALALDGTSGQLIGAMTVNKSGPTTEASLAFMDRANMDKAVSAPTAAPIYYQATTKSFDFDAPLKQKSFTDVGLEISIGNASDVYGIKPYYDYSATASVADTFTLAPTTTGRQIFQLPLGQAGAPAASFGSDARASMWEIWGNSSTRNTIWHNMSLGYIELDDLQKGRVTDWLDLGYPWDKRMKTVTIEYNVTDKEVDLYLDYIYGKDGDSISLATQTLTLGLGTGTERAKQTFPILDGIVAKMVRLRPKVSTDQYQILGTPEWDFDRYPADIVYFTDYSDYGHKYEKRFYVLYVNADTNGQDVTVDIEGDGIVKQTVIINGTAANRMVSTAINVDIVAKLVRLNVTNIPTGGKFQLFDHSFDKENFPAEIVLSTEWSNHGYEYSKYFEQVNFDVNTGGEDIPVKIYGDGVLKQTVIVNTTQSTRNVNITVNPSMTCKIMRLEVDPALIPSGGRFQLWGYRPIFVPADPGRVTHTYDWTDAGHPYDKKFVEMTFEYETNADTVQIAVDTLTGINGTTETLLVKTFSINSTGRGKAVVALTKNDGSEIIAKMVRVRTTGLSGGGTNDYDFKMWDVKFPGLIPYPADTMPFTDWTDNGWSCDKVFRGLGLEIDTGGVACTVYLDVDGTTGADSWTVNTNTNDRRVFLSPHTSTEIIGKMFRLRFAAGTGGKAQLFNQPNWDLVNDACEFIFFDTFEQAFGSAGYTVIKQIWIDRKCAGTTTLKIYNEEGTLFYTHSIPASTTRAPYRFFVPSVYNGVINKSKKHRVTLESDDDTKPIKVFRDSSRIEYVNLSHDERDGYYQSIIWQNLKIAV